MLSVKLRFSSVPNIYSNELEHGKSAKALTQHSSFDITVAATKDILQVPSCNKDEKKPKHDDVLPTFVVNGISYREEPFAITNEEVESADMLLLTEEDITQMKNEFKACNSNSYLNDKAGDLPSDFSTIPSDTLCKLSTGLEFNTHSWISNNKGKQSEVSQTKLSNTTEANDDVEEVLVPLEVCVMTPSVDEIWSGWPNPDDARSPSAALFSSILSLGEAMKGYSNPFLCIYTAPCARCLSQEVETVVCVAVMRVLRCHLLSLLRSTIGCGGDELPHQALRELLQQYCEVSGTACRVRWHPLMVQEVAKSLNMNSVFPRAQNLHSTRGGTLRGYMEKKKDSFSHTNDVADAHEVAVLPPVTVGPQAEDGMDLWSDDGDLSEGDESPEERIIKASRRHFTTGAANCNSDSIVRPVVGASSTPSSVLTPFVVWDLNLTWTCLPLQWMWYHCIPKQSRRKSIALQVTIDSLMPVHQSQKDERLLVGLIHRLYDKFLLTAERHRESGNSNFADLDVLTATVADYENVMRSYEACIFLAQRGLVLPYKMHRLSRGAFTTTTLHSTDGRYEALQESRRRIHRVLQNLSSEISEDVSLHLTPMRNKGLNAKHPTRLLQNENATHVKGSKDMLQRNNNYKLLMGVPGDNYFNEVLLSIQLDSETGVGSLSNMLSERVRADPILEPARLAMGPDKPTPLHLILYMLRRQLVASIANAALIALRIHSLHEVSYYKPSSTQNASILQDYQTSQPPNRWSIQLLERYARPCDGASTLVLELLKWHTLSTDADIGKKSASFLPKVKMERTVADVQEVVWCVSIYVKLRLRGLRLWGCVGNQDKKQAWMRDLRDTLELWDRRRRHALEMLTVEPGEARLENFFAKIPESTWYTLLKDAQDSMGREL